MTAVVLEKVWKEYGDQVVLENIDLTIESGSFVALVGPSGCGKTTLLKMLLGEEKPTSGSILMDGTPLKPEPDWDGNVLIGREFEKAGFVGRLFGDNRKAAIEDARALLAAVGLSQHENKYPAALSGGMQQRLALAQALMRRPKVLLLDEPFGALDPGIRSEVHALMTELWLEQGITVVMVTHDLSEAFRLGTRVIALERRRNRPEEAERYGSTIAHDIEVWPPKPNKKPNGSAAISALPPASEFAAQPLN